MNPPASGCSTGNATLMLENTSEPITDGIGRADAVTSLLTDESQATFIYTMHMIVTSQSSSCLRL